MINSTTINPKNWTDSTEINRQAAKWGKISLVALGTLFLAGAIVGTVFCCTTHTTYWDSVNLRWAYSSNAIFSIDTVFAGVVFPGTCFALAIVLHVDSKKNYTKPEERDKAKELLLVDTPLELQKALRLSYKDSLGAAVRSELISIKDGERIQEMMKEYSTADSTVQRLKDGSPELKDRTPVGMIYEEHRKERDAAQDTLNKLQQEWKDLQEKWKKEWAPALVVLENL